MAAEHRANRTDATDPRGQVADRLRPFGETIFAEMTRLAIEHEAVNLAQGFPDFDGPAYIRDAAAEAIHKGPNQYARSIGVPELNRAIAENWAEFTGIEIDPDAQVTITSGCTEAIAATLLGLVNPGDEVILFEPFYDSYLAAIAMAGATPVPVTLRPPGPDAPSLSPFRFDHSELRAAFGPRTRAIIVNTPHNPTGKVFTQSELSAIADLCIASDVIAITDEVYEHLVYEPDQQHIRLGALPGMQSRSVTCSSIGKTFSLTGWKVGWAIASPSLTAGVRAAHQYLTFAAPPALQIASALALSDGADAVADINARFTSTRGMLADALRAMGMRVFWPSGGYFIMADHTTLGFSSDVEFCQALIREAKVAAIPPSSFYINPSHGSNLVRFAFCKSTETMREATRRLERFVPAKTGPVA